MSPIEYRIYDKSAGKFQYSGSTPTMLASFFRVTAVLDTRDGQEYQQYTGLKDKNRVKIFERDVVRVAPAQGLYSGTKVVEWNDAGCWEPFVLNCVDGYDYATDSKFCTVIGNATANPELHDARTYCEAVIKIQAASVQLNTPYERGKLEVAETVIKLLEKK